MASTAPDAGPVLLVPLTRLPCDPAVAAPAVRAMLGAAVEIRPMALELELAHDAPRNQYNSTTLLRLLLAARPAEAARIVGLVDLDLFIPVLTYVFGEAQLGGTAAVVSTYRLREPWALGGAPRPLVEARFTKTVLHELGHTMGLRHCMDPRCVMASASGLELLDDKAAAFCLECRAAMRGA
jgi:archaemetzincin